MTDRNRRILIVDDNREIHGDFRKVLATPAPAGAAAAAAALNSMEDALFGGTPVGTAPDAGDDGPTAAATTYELDSAYQGKEGYDRVVASVAAGRPYVVAFVDMRMPPGWDGVETVEHLWRADPDLQVVICTAFTDYSWVEVLRRLTGSGDRLLILKKPFDAAEVAQLACALAEKWHLARQARLKLSQLKSMVAEQTRELGATNARLEAEVADRRKTEVHLRDGAARFQATFDASVVGQAHVDSATGLFLRVNRKLSAITGFDEGELLSMTVEQLTHPAERDATRVVISSLRAADVAGTGGRPPEYFGEKRYVCKDGRTIWVQLSTTLVHPSGEEPPYFVSVIQDITDRKAAEAQLRHDAFHDPLTGLANRALLTHQLRHCLARAERDPAERFAVLFLDLDRFKTVNDAFGHEVGDHLLMAVGRRLAECVRQIDLVARPAGAPAADPTAADLGPAGDAGESRLVRLGGDEFVLLLERIGTPARAMEVGERLRRALAEPVIVDGHSLYTPASIGIAVYRPEYRTPEEVLRDADTALYRAKTERGVCAIFDQPMHDAVVARWRLETALRGAVAAGQMELHFQPVVSLTTGRVVEFEALIRWRHPERGLIPPGEFIPLAEELGVIVEMGRWTIRRACQLVARWAAEMGPGAPPVAVALNVSGRELARPDLVDAVAAALAETGVDPARIHLELTETAIISNAAAATATLTRLRGLGVAIHLDDFGTGYSSLSYLHRMPVDTLKVDQSFVRTMESDPTSRSIVQTIVTLAHTLGIPVIAEGVETAGQAGLLTALGCDSAQGYLYAKPMPADQVTAYMAARGSAPAVTGGLRLGVAA